MIRSLMLLAGDRGGEQISNRGEWEVVEEPLQSVSGQLEIVVVPEFFERRHGDAGLPGIDFPRVDVEDDGAACQIAAAHQSARGCVGEQAEIASAAAGHFAAEYFSATHRQLERA